MTAETPFARLRELFSYAFKRFDYDDPNIPETPIELREFGSNTVFVMGAGMAFGGIQQWWRERGAPEPNIPSGFSKAERAKLIAELKTRQLLRIMNWTLKGGLWCGWLGALYFGVEGLSAYARKMQDPWNTVLAAWACGSVFGFAVGGPSPVSRLKSAAGAVFIAGLVGYPMGHLQIYLKSLVRANEKEEAAKVDLVDAAFNGQTREESEKLEQRRSSYPVRDYDVVAAVICKLDQSLQENEKFKTDRH